MVWSVCSYICLVSQLLTPDNYLQIRGGSPLPIAINCNMWRSRNVRNDSHIWKCQGYNSNPVTDRATGSDTIYGPDVVSQKHCSSVPCAPSWSTKMKMVSPGRSRAGRTSLQPWGHKPERQKSHALPIRTAKKDHHKKNYNQNNYKLTTPQKNGKMYTHLSVIVLPFMTAYNGFRFCPYNLIRLVN